jgi:hypothetical protein
MRPAGPPPTTATISPASGGAIAATARGLDAPTDEPNKGFKVNFFPQRLVYSLPHKDGLDLKMLKSGVSVTI